MAAKWPFKGIFPYKNTHLALLNSVFCKSSSLKISIFRFKQPFLNNFFQNFTIMKLNLFYAIALLCPVLSFAQQNSPTPPLDDIVVRTTLEEKGPLPYPPLREADILWSQKVWQEIDTRQKQNLTFRSPHAALYEILESGIKSGELTAYSPEDDRFSMPMSIEEFIDATSSVDTLVIFDMDYNERTEIVREMLDYESIIKFRVKEVWYFDALTGSLRVRILGIAPIAVKETDDGDALFEYPVFWVYYPNCREYLAKYEVFNPENDMGRMSWEDLFEMRKFDATIIKASNILDKKLSNSFVGRDLLLESEKIKTKIRDKEMDVWSY